MVSHFDRFKEVDGKYMIRRKFFIPQDELLRDYRDGHERYASNYLFDSDYEEVNENDEDSITTEQ